MADCRNGPLRIMQRRKHKKESGAQSKHLCPRKGKMERHIHSASRLTSVYSFQVGQARGCARANLDRCRSLDWVDLGAYMLQFYAVSVTESTLRAFHSPSHCHSLVWSLSRSVPVVQASENEGGAPNLRNQNTDCWVRSLDFYLDNAAFVPIEERMNDTI